MTFEMRSIELTASVEKELFCEKRKLRHDIKCVQIHGGCIIHALVINRLIASNKSREQTRQTVSD